MSTCDHRITKGGKLCISVLDLSLAHFFFLAPSVVTEPLAPQHKLLALPRNMCLYHDLHDLHDLHDVSTLYQKKYEVALEAYFGAFANLGTVLGCIPRL